MIDLFLAHDDPAFLAAFKAALASLPDLNLVSETTDGVEAVAAVMTFRTTRPRMLVVKLALLGEEGFAKLWQVKQETPDAVIVPVLEGTESGQGWMELLSLGLRDVMFPHLPSVEILKVLKSASIRAEERGHDPIFPNLVESYVISIVSARAVQGKTVIATNLAAALPRPNAQVLLLDFSPHSHDFPIFLDDKAKINVIEALSAPNPLKDNLNWHPRLKFNYLSSPKDTPGIQAFDSGLALDLFKRSKALADYTVVDTGDSKSATTLAAIDSSELILVVTSRDVARLISTRDYLKFLKDERKIQPVRIKVILNQADVGAEISEEEIAGLLEHPVGFTIPSAPGVVTFSINTGAPVVIAHPSHPVSVALNQLAKLCYNHWEERPDDGGDDSPSGANGPLGDGPDDDQGSPVPKISPVPLLTGTAKVGSDRLL